jgi:hypothetical protein
MNHCSTSDYNNGMELASMLSLYKKLAFNKVMMVKILNLLVSRSGSSGRFSGDIVPYLQMVRFHLGDLSRI